MNTGFDLLVLDCDGVILDSMDVKTEAMRRVGEAFGPELCDRLVVFQRLEGGISRFEKFAWLQKEAYGRDITPAELQAMSADYLRHLDDALNYCTLVPGTEELLRAWHGRVPIYVCSGAPHDELNDILTARGLAGYFTRICGYPPAKTELLRSIVREVGSAPERTVMVGDTVTDSRAADETGTLFYGIGPMFAQTAYPHGRDLHDLHAWLMQLGG